MVFVLRMRNPMIRKLALLAVAIALPAQAEHGPIDPAEKQYIHHDTHAPIHAQHGLYVAAKGLTTLGERVSHGANTVLDGDSGRGLGFELGYKLGHGFAVEGDASFAENKVTETHCGSEHRKAEQECTHERASGHYSTVSLDLVYLAHPTKNIGTFVKTGFEYESESINSLGIHGNDTGVIYAAGAEYALSHHAAFLVEYEGTTIESPRGHGVFAGVVYAF